MAAAAAAAGDFWFKVASFTLVGMLWGCSNAVLKRATAGPGSSGGRRGTKQQQQEASTGGGVWAGLKALLGTKVKERSESTSVRPSLDRSIRLSLTLSSPPS